VFVILNFSTQSLTKLLNLQMTVENLTILLNPQMSVKNLTKLLNLQMTVEIETPQVPARASNTTSEREPMANTKSISVGAKWKFIVTT
jgi:hypothetical protein